MNGKVKLAGFVLTLGALITPGMSADEIDDTSAHFIKEVGA